MDKLVIGGTYRTGVLWEPCFEDGILWQSKIGYKMYCNLFDCDVYVLTACPEFNTLDARFKQEGSAFVVEHLAIEFILKYKNTNEIVNAINGLKKKSYEEGYRACQSDIRSVIGFNEADYRGSELVELNIPKSRDGKGFNGYVECDSL